MFKWIDESWLQLECNFWMSYANLDKYWRTSGRKSLYLKNQVTEGGVHIVSIKGEVYPKTYWENSTSSKEIILAGVLRLKHLPKRNLNKFRPWQTHSNPYLPDTSWCYFKATKSHMLEAREISIAFHLQKPFLFLKFIHRSKEINFMKKLWKFHISSIHFAKDLHVLYKQCRKDDDGNKKFVKY